MKNINPHVIPTAKIYSNGSRMKKIRWIMVRCYDMEPSFRYHLDIYHWKLRATSVMDNYYKQNIIQEFLKIYSYTAAIIIHNAIIPSGYGKILTLTPNFVAAVADDE
jgi:hypothetical protein